MVGPGAPVCGSGTIAGCPIPLVPAARFRGGRVGLRLRAGLVACALGGDVGLGLADHELFLRHARAAGELGQLVGAEDEQSDADDGGDFDGGEHRLLRLLEERVRERGELGSGRGVAERCE